MEQGTTGEAQHWSDEDAYADRHGYQLTRIADALERIAVALEGAKETS